LRHHREEYVFQITKAFQIIEYVPTLFTTMNGNQSNGFYYIGRKK